MVLERRDGRRYLVIDDILMRNSYYSTLSDYDDNLIEIKTKNPQLDIVRVYKEILNYDVLDYTNDLLWERKAYKEVTITDEFVNVDELIDLCKDVSATKISFDKKGQTQLLNWLEEYRALLKRNTEMKVAYLTNERNDGILRGKCPKCSTPVSHREDVNFCGTCGQRLRWYLW